MDENVDVELLIDAVKNRQEIWDVSHQWYKDRNKKQAAWESICEDIFGEDFGEKTENEKNAWIKKLSLKWKNLKDNYSRSARKKTKSGQAASSGRQYIYARQMSFLEASTALATTDSRVFKSEHPDASDLHSQQQEGEEDIPLPQSASPIPSTSTQPSPSTGASSRTGSKRPRNFESSLLEFINSRITVEPPDEDRAFFDSLIPTIKTFTADQKLDFRCEVLNIVRRMKRQSKSHVAIRY